MTRDRIVSCICAGHLYPGKALHRQPERYQLRRARPTRAHDAGLLLAGVPSFGGASSLRFGLLYLHALCARSIILLYPTCLR